MCVKCEVNDEAPPCPNWMCMCVYVYTVLRVHDCVCFANRLCVMELWPVYLRVRVIEVRGVCVLCVLYTDCLRKIPEVLSISVKLISIWGDHSADARIIVQANYLERPLTETEDTYTIISNSAIRSIHGRRVAQRPLSNPCATLSSVCCCCAAATPPAALDALRSIQPANWVKSPATHTHAHP